MPVYVILLFNLIKISVFLSPVWTGRESGTAVLLPPVWFMCPPCYWSRLNALGHVSSLGVIFLYLWQDCITSRKAISNHKAISRRGEQASKSLDLTLHNKMPFTFRLNELVISPKGKGRSVAQASRLSSRCPQLQKGDAMDKRCWPWLLQGALWPGSSPREQ